jgi:hypothetical protein
MDDIHHLTDRHMNQLCKRMTNLKQISMWSSARYLSGFAFKQLGSLTKLTTLKFDSNKLITDEVRRGHHLDPNSSIDIVSSSLREFFESRTILAVDCSTPVIFSMSFPSQI